MVRLGNVTVDGEKQEAKTKNPEAPEPDCVTRFCGGAFNRTIVRFRIVFVIGFFIFGIVAGVIASGIGPLTKEEEFLPKEHELMALLADI